jgi:Ca2+/Na+ antiporter
MTTVLSILGVLFLVGYFILMMKHFSRSKELTTEQRKNDPQLERITRMLRYYVFIGFAVLITVGVCWKQPG